MHRVIDQIPYGENEWLLEMAVVIANHIFIHDDRIVVSRYKEGNGVLRLLEELLGDRDLEKQLAPYRRRLIHHQVIDAEHIVLLLSGESGTLPDPLRITPTPDDQFYFQFVFFNEVLVLGMLDGLLKMPNPDGLGIPESHAEYIKSMVEGARIRHAAHDRDALYTGGRLMMQPPPSRPSRLSRYLFASA